MVEIFQIFFFFFFLIFFKEKNFKFFFLNFRRKKFDLVRKNLQKCAKVTKFQRFTKISTCWLTVHRDGWTFWFLQLFAQN